MADKYLMHDAVEQCATWLQENLSASSCDAVLHVAGCLGDDRLAAAAQEYRERLQQGSLDTRPPMPAQIRPPATPSVPLPDSPQTWETPKSGGSTWWDLLADIVALFDL